MVMTRENWKTRRRKPAPMSLCSQKSHTDWPGIEPGLQRCDRHGQSGCCHRLHNKLHSVAYQKIAVFIVTAMKRSELFNIYWTKKSKTA